MVSHGHRLDLVMGDIDRGRAQAVVQGSDLHPHVDAEGRVEVRERLVEEERLGVADNRPAHCDTLALAARQLSRVTLQQGLQTDDLGHLVGLLARCLFAEALKPQGIGEISQHVHVRVERVGLEHHCHVSLSGRHVVYRLSSDLQGAGGDRLQPGDAAQQRGLTASRRPYQRGERALGNR